MDDLAYLMAAWDKCAAKSRTFAWGSDARSKAQRARGHHRAGRGGPRPTRQAATRLRGYPRTSGENRLRIDAHRRYAVFRRLYVPPILQSRRVCFDTGIDDCPRWYTPGSYGSYRSVEAVSEAASPGRDNDEPDSFRSNRLVGRAQKRPIWAGPGSQAATVASKLCWVSSARRAAAAGASHRLVSSRGSRSRS